MNSTQELVELTQLYLKQEFESTDRIYTSKESYDYYVAYAKSHGVKKTPTPPPVQKPVQYAPPPQPIPKPLPKPVQPKQAPPAEKPKIKKEVERAGMQKAEGVDLSDIKRIITEKFPAQSIIDKIPDDKKAKEMKELWKQNRKVALLIAQNPDEKAFLKKIGEAIDHRFGPIELVDSESVDKPEGVRLVIARERVDWEGVTYIPIEEISVYKEHPEKKAPLWKAICEALS